MKKFNFSLEKILQFKNQSLKNLKNDLANLQFMLNAKDAEIAQLKNKYIESEQTYKDKINSSMLTNEIQCYKDYMNSILNEIKKKSEEKQILSMKIEQKKLEIIEANKEVSSIDKLKEKKVEDYNKSVQKAEELFIEEFVSTSKVMGSQSI